MTYPAKGGELLDTGPLKRLGRRYPLGDPLGAAIAALPDAVTREEFVTLGPLLVALVRLRR